MLNAESIIRNMFRYRYDILKSMIDANVSLAVYGSGDKMDTVKTGLDINSIVREQDGKSISVLPEKLQLIAGSDLRNLIHDMALAAYLYTGLRPVDAGFEDRRQQQQYEKGLERMDVLVAIVLW